MRKKADWLDMPSKIRKRLLNSIRSPYIKPAWHFVGHFEDGTQLDVLIQAIKQELLLPERVPSLGLG